MTATFDVVLVPFPFVERRQVKQRPALVVSSPALDDLGLCWVAMITSREEAARPGDYPIKDLGDAGLPVASWVRASKIATLDRDAILRKLGRLSASDQDGARDVLGVCAGW